MSVSFGHGLPDTYGVTVTATPTISTGIYASGDALGTRMDFANAVRLAGGSGSIVKVVIIDDADQSAAIDIVFFDRPFTATADNAAFDPTDADLQNCIGHIPIAVSEYSSFNDNCEATDLPGGGWDFTLNEGETTLYAQMVVRGTPTYAATDDLTVKLEIQQY